MYFGTSYGGSGSSSSGYTLALKPPVPPALSIPSYTSSSYLLATTPLVNNNKPATPPRIPPTGVNPQYSTPPHRGPSPPAKQDGCKQCENKRQSPLEVVGAKLSGGKEGPLYDIKLNINGRSYVVSRHHNKLRSLIEQLKRKGCYPNLKSFPEVEELVTMAPAKAMEDTLGALPFYEGFGYSIKSVARTMLRSSVRSVQMEQISQRIDSFLKNIFTDHEEDLINEQTISHFFWEPLEKSLPPVQEEEEEVEA